MNLNITLSLVGINPDGTDETGAYVDCNVDTLRGPATDEKPFALPDGVVFCVRPNGGVDGPSVSTGVLRVHLDTESLCVKAPQS